MNLNTKKAVPLNSRMVGDQGDINMNFAELLEKHKKEDGTVDYEAAQAEYDSLKNQEFETEKQKLDGNRQQILSEKKKLQDRLKEIEKEFETKKIETATQNDNFKDLYDSEKTAREKLEEQMNLKTNKFKQSILDATISAKLQENGVRPEIARLLKREFLDKADIIEDEDGSFKHVAKIGTDHIDINEYIKSTLGKDEYKAYISAPENSGGGAGGSKVVGGGGGNGYANPFKKESLNLSEQSKLRVSDPDKFERLKAEAKSAQ